MQIEKATQGYVLCRMVIGGRERVDSDRTEFDACNAAVDGLLHICDAEDKYESFIENYVEWEEAINHLALRDMVTWAIDEIHWQNARKLLARKLANLLASARLYVDSIPKHAAHVLADDLPALAEVKIAPSVQYDNHLAYRVLEALRNYSQHYALPIHGASTHAQWHRDLEPHSLSFTMWPQINLAQLEKDGDFKKTVLAEIQALEKVELKPMVRQYVECMSLIHKTFRSATKQKASAWVEQLMRSTARFASKFPEVGTLGLAILPINERGLKAGDEVYVDGPLPKYLLHMQSKYSAMMNFAKRRIDF